MRLLRLADVETSLGDRVFCYSRTTALVSAFVVISTSAGLLYYAYSAHWRFGYYFATVILLFLVLMRRLITARFRASNWLVRMNDLGVFIQFRSYLNYHLPADDLTVVFVTFQEILSARLVRERARVPDAQGKTATQILRYVELELAGNPEPLSKALDTECGEKAPTEKRWYGSTSTLYQDHPVRMDSPPFLRLRWQVFPGTHRFLDALRPYTTIAETVSITQDYAHLEALSRKEQETRLRELDRRGETIAAIYIARRLYGCGLQQAQQMVEGLRNKSLAQTN
jgi:hypothetical protein